MPNDTYKVKWDIWIIFVLFFVAMTLPFQIGFVEKPGKGWTVLNYIVDASFVTDMLLTFFTGIHDSSTNELVLDKKKIAQHYVSGWFAIDLISIIPFDKLIKTPDLKDKNSLQLAKMTRLSRISKFIRLVRIVRMMKMLRICKDSEKIKDRAEDVVKLS